MAPQSQPHRNAERFLIGVPELNRIITQLKSEGYLVLGPTVRGLALKYSEIQSTQDLPQGYGQAQGPGKYELIRRGDERYFDYATLVDSVKRHFFAPEARLVHIRKKGNTFEASRPAATERKVAVLGLRSCDLAAIQKQDRIFLEGATVDTDYQERRADAFVIAVQCAVAEDTCFCASTDTGPEARWGFDLALTELNQKPGMFLLEIGTDRGQAIAHALKSRPASDADVEEAAQIVNQTRSQMKRGVSIDGIQEMLYQSQESPLWQDIAKRCLSCANCTLACPTCFCSTLEDATDLDGNATRTRRWDSCFTLDHSYIHGGPVRGAVSSRYRQWLTHKWAGWIDQFGEGGCVGCGRCITLCPAGIDLTEELRRLRARTEVSA